MRDIYCLALSLWAAAAAAVTLDVPRLPAPSFADREVSGDAALPSGRTDDLRTALKRCSCQRTRRHYKSALGRRSNERDGVRGHQSFRCCYG